MAQSNKTCLLRPFSLSCPVSSSAPHQPACFSFSTFLAVVSYESPAADELVKQLSGDDNQVQCPTILSLLACVRQEIIFDDVFQAGTSF